MHFHIFAEIDIVYSYRAKSTYTTCVISCPSNSFTTLHCAKFICFMFEGESLEMAAFAEIPNLVSLSLMLRIYNYI